MAKVTGGEVIVDMLRMENVQKVFGIIDGTYFGFYGKLQENNMTLITPRHETSAAHMAGAYARSTGQLGVCMASNGPGVANLLPGLVVEEGEGNRVLAITSSRRTGIIEPTRPGAYQRFSQTKVIAEIAKWSHIAFSVERIPELMRTALRKCYEGRPGVVHLDIPEDIMNGTFKLDYELWRPEQYRMIQGPWAAEQQIQAAADLLSRADFPVIHAGSGVIHAQAYDVLEAVVDQLQAMVTTSWGGRGSIRENHSLVVPMTHISLNHHIHNAADVVLVLGSRLGETDWWGKAPYWRAHQHVIQVDIDADIIGANKPVKLGIQAELRGFCNNYMMCWPNNHRQMLCAIIKKKSYLFNMNVRKKGHHLMKN